MIIRQARVGDAAAITVMLNDVVDKTTISFSSVRKTEESVAEDIRARGPAFQVAEKDGDVVGFATYFPFRAGPGYGRTKEHSIVLSAKARGQGTGRALMTGLQEVARAEGVHVLMAGVSGENPSGLAFHAAIGFVEVGRLSEVGFKFDRYLDLVLMQKVL